MSPIVAAERTTPRAPATEDSLQPLIGELLRGVRDANMLETACDQVFRSIHRILIAQLR